MAKKLNFAKRTQSGGTGSSAFVKNEIRQIKANISNEINDRCPGKANSKANFGGKANSCDAL